MRRGRENKQQYETNIAMCWCIVWLYVVWHVDSVCGERHSDYVFVDALIMHMLCMGVTMNAFVQYA